MLENITVVYQAENIFMAVNNFQELSGFLTASKQDISFVAHVDW